MTPTTRTAVPEDWEAIRNLLVKCKLPTAGAHDHLRTFLVIHGEAGLIACGGVEHHGRDVLLRSIAVAGGYRGNGIGRALVANLLATAKDAGAGTVVLLTEGAEQFFLGLGFRVVPRQDLPVTVMASAEFRGACPASATAMVLDLSAVHA